MPTQVIDSESARKYSDPDAFIPVPTIHKHIVLYNTVITFPSGKDHIIRIVRNSGVLQGSKGFECFTGIMNTHDIGGIAHEIWYDRCIVVERVPRPNLTGTRRVTALSEFKQMFALPWGDNIETRDGVQWRLNDIAFVQKIWFETVVAYSFFALR